MIPGLSDLHVDPSDFEEEKLNFAQGSFGKVSLVHPKDKPNEKIARKEIIIEDSRNQQFFIREITNMVNINHPCVIKLIGYSTIGQTNYYIYMPYISNGDLDKAIKQDFDLEEKVLTPTIRSKIIYGIASAMSALHKSNIIHRDLKPENIMLDENFNPIIADLGLGRIFGINMTLQLGTPLYMAPELLSTIGDAEVTMKIDVYAFAVTLLSFFTESFRFLNKKIKNRKEFVSEIISGNRFEIPSNVPDFYKELITKCWDQNPNERPSFDDIVNEFENNDGFILDGSDVDEVKGYINMIKNGSPEGTPTPTSERAYTETEEFDFG